MMGCDWQTCVLIQGLEVVAGGREVSEDFVDDALLQVRVTADAQAVRQRQHKPLLHLQHTTCFELDLKG